MQNNSQRTVSEIIRLYQLHEVIPNSVKIDCDYNNNKGRVNIEIIRLKGQPRKQGLKIEYSKKLNLKKTKNELDKLINKLNLEHFKICEKDGIYIQDQTLMICKIGYIGLSILLNEYSQIWINSIDKVAELIKEPMQIMELKDKNNEINALILINILDQGLGAITRDIELSDLLLINELMDNNLWTEYQNQLYSTQNEILKKLI